MAPQLRPFSTAKQVTRPKTCYYKLLNVSTTANPKEIKKAYYKLGKQGHSVSDLFAFSKEIPS